MQIRYKVHGVSHDEAEVDAVVAGQTVRAKIPVLTVEMGSEDGSMGHTFRFSQFTDEQVKGFAVGADFDVTFTPVE